MTARRVQGVAALVALFALAAAPSAAGAAGSQGSAGSQVSRLSIDGAQDLYHGYTRVYGEAVGRVDGSERINGLPAEGVRYRAPFELIAGSRADSRLLLVEAENRGSPLLLNALADGSVAGAPATAAYPSSVSDFLHDEHVAYARVAWQTVISPDVPGDAQGVGEAIVRDFGLELSDRFRRRALVGVSQGAFFVDTFLAEGFNRRGRGGPQAYGRALTVDGNGNWLAINRLPHTFLQNPYLRPDGRPLTYEQMLHRPGNDPKLVDVANLTDFYRLRAGLTGAEPLPAGVRRYDWPSPHQSFAPALVFGAFNCNDGVQIPLNPLRYTPYLRGLVHGMARGQLPASQRFRLGRSPESSPNFNGLPTVDVPVPKYSGAGQPLGGVRFPEQTQPLGRLRPAALSPAVTTSSFAVCGNSGGFQPLAPEAIAERSSKAEWLREYDRRLHALQARGYLRRTDLQGMLGAARADYEAALAGTLGS